jgi:hypothetical protein
VTPDRRTAGEVEVARRALQVTEDRLTRPYLRFLPPATGTFIVPRFPRLRALVARVLGR